MSEWMSDRIVVVPLDMSEFSFKALAAAQNLVPHTNNIRIVHVVPPSDSSGIRIEHRDEQTKITLLAFLKEHGYPDMDVTILSGDPVKQIVQFAETVSAGLIVIPSHGRGMLTEMLLGSTTYSVVRRAHCPVLVLKPLKNKSAQ